MLEWQWCCILMIECKNQNVNYFLQYYDVITNALVACWEVVINRKSTNGPRRPVYLMISWASMPMRENCNTLWNGDKLNQLLLTMFFFPCINFNGLWDHLFNVKCLILELWCRILEVGVGHRCLGDVPGRIYKGSLVQPFEMLRVHEY